MDKLFEAVNWTLSKIWGESDLEPEDANRTLEEVIESRGFHAEVHQVTSADGYILTLQRIVRPGKSRPRSLDENSNIGGPAEDTPPNGHPVLLMHGFGSNGASWVTLFGDGHFCSDKSDLSDKSFDNNLGFCLANHGYDVWLGNMRSSVLSRGHTSLSPESPAYWDFTIDQIVEYDMPLSIDYILKATGSKTVGYAGISLGSTVMFGLLASKPEYNEVIKPFIALAPCWRLSNMKSPIKHLIRLITYRYSRNPNRPAPTTTNDKLMQFGADYYPFTKPFCTLGFALTSLMSGYNWNFFKARRINVFLKHNSAMASEKQVVHSGQYILRNRPFSKFDYGQEKNLELYGEETPPMYDVAKITNKFMSFMYSSNDWALNLEDVKFTKDRLSVPLMDDFHVPDPMWTHYDFQMAPNVGNVVNRRIVDVLNRACTGNK